MGGAYSSIVGVGVLSVASASIDGAAVGGTIAAGTLRAPLGLLTLMAQQTVSSPPDLSNGHWVE